MRKQLLITFGLVLLIGLMLVPSGTATDTGIENKVLSERVYTSSSSGLLHTDLTEHDQFIIVYNDNFTDMGFSGSGTLESPYIIENLSIYVGSTEIGIKIGTVVDANYTIRNCLFWTNVTDGHWGLVLWGGGVVVENCEFDGLKISTKELGYLTVQDCFMSASPSKYENIEVSRTEGECRIVDNDLRNMTINIQDDVHGAIITGNTLLGTNFNGAGIKTASNDTLISDNDIEGYTSGITMSASSGGWTSGAEITENTIKDVVNTGIYVHNASVISMNMIEGASTGIKVIANFSIIRNNTILDSAEGIFFTYYTTQNQIYYNRIACSGLNGAERGEGNVWDDGISRGNWWDDAVMGTPYDITDIVTEEVINQDRWPVLYEFDAPEIDSPGDLTFMVGSINMEATWNVSDETPKHFSLLVNGSVEQSGAWDGSNITLDMGDWTIATYNVTLVLTDWSDNTAIDSITVVVQNQLPTTTPPETSTDTTGTPTGEGTFPMELALGAGALAVIVVLGAAIAAKRR